MAKKATHRGTCQCCGRLQKLPGGLLSKHGYTVDWGYFNGVCWGAHHQPLELDRKILDGAILRLNEEAEYALTHDPVNVVCNVARERRYVGRRSVHSGGEVAFDDFEAFRALALERKDGWRLQGWRRGFEYSGELAEKYGSPEEQEERLISEKYAEARQSAIRRAHADARRAQQHAVWLAKHADEVHGQPLKEIK
jgi:hypothetical protein